MRIDPIDFEIFKNLFVSIAEEMGVTLCRTVLAQHQGAARLLVRRY